MDQEFKSSKNNIFVFFITLFFVGAGFVFAMYSPYGDRPFAEAISCTFNSQCIPIERCDGGECVFTKSGNPQPDRTTCGDAICETPNENADTCPVDCMICGDGICSPGEACGLDCETFFCGDGVCDPGEGESLCAPDCGYCGDAICDVSWESSDTCQADCGEIVPVCGNDICDPNEDSASCDVDCGWCGDGFCSNEEWDGRSCSSDCVYPVTCGDLICDAGEDPYDCSIDCGWCGDGTCDYPGEDQSWCPSDCVL